MKSVDDLKLIHKIHQFYYAEARMLDEKRYQEWLKLLSPGIEYLMPNRSNTQESSQDTPLRNDDIMTLTLRASRPANPKAWADNPGSRTRRSVNNIEIFVDKRNHYQIFNNTVMDYSRHSQDNHIFIFQRQDILSESDANESGFQIISRKIILDWNVITAPTVAMIL
jgi:3-phenylpropionate/cinnamic acid dioxygenase small subunit